MIRHSTFNSILIVIRIAPMPRFNYVALDARGQEASGLLEAASSSAAISQLRQAGYFPTSVIEEAIISSDGKEARATGSNGRRGRRNRARKKASFFSSAERLSQKS